MTVAKKPRSCQQLPARPIPLRSWASGPAPTPVLHPFPGRDGCSERRGSWGQLAGGHVPAGPEGDPGMCLGWLQVDSSFLCDLEQVTSSLATSFFLVQVSYLCRQVSRPNKAGSMLDLRKMLAMAAGPGPAMGRPLGAKARQQD